jgi:hypothetical protein
VVARCVADFYVSINLHNRPDGRTLKYGRLTIICAAMVKRSGSADLPLHGGRVPPWLASRMATLGAVICEAIVHRYGRDEFLRRLSHPFWFQSFGP